MVKKKLGQHGKGKETSVREMRLPQPVNILWSQLLSVSMQIKEEKTGKSLVSATAVFGIGGGNPLGKQ